MGDQSKELFQMTRGQLDGPGRGGVNVQRVAIAEQVLAGTGPLASLAALFPQVEFVSTLGAWPESYPSPCDILFVAGRADDADNLVQRLKTRPRNLQVIVALHDADVLTTRRLLREGAADVVPAPVSETACALSLQRILESVGQPRARRKGGEVVAFLKAGGGVGATALATQLAAMLATRSGEEVCIADLDLQFGAAALYLDVADAITITDCLGAGSALAETPFSTALAKHKSGARVLAAPREMMPLETIGPVQIDALLQGLRRDFPLNLVDLPTVWTSWTNRVLSLADRLVLVTQLSVPNIQLAKRQLRTLTMQDLDSKPLILVCNGLSTDQQALVSINAAERALGREFDVVIPEDRRVMTTAINQGVEVGSVRRGTKLEKALELLAQRVAEHALQTVAEPRKR